MKIDERRVLVVGASSGVGRDIGEALAARGARVAFAARRGDMTAEAASAAGEHCIGLACDVRDDASCDAVVAEAVEAFGGLDTLIYAAAVGPLADLKDADGAIWREALDTNLIGASLVTRAAIEHLESPGGSGRAIYLSSVSGSTTTPWPGLALYAVSKAALERMVDGWRIEHPGVRFSAILLGPMAPGSDVPPSFTAGWDPEKATEAVQRWISMGLVGSRLTDPADLCEQVVAILTASATVSKIIIEP